MDRQLKRINTIIILLIFGFISSNSSATSFQSIVENLKNHTLKSSLVERAKSKLASAKKQGSWGDPMFKIAGKNFPKDSLKDNKTPMTGLEFSLSQKIALTPKYGFLKDGISLKSKSLELQSEDMFSTLLMNFWNHIISLQETDEKIKIYKENLGWIENILKVSKKRYANGKISQQALLEIQVRKSKIEAKLSNSTFTQKSILENIQYFSDEEISGFDSKSVPWSLIDKKEGNEVDFKEESLKAKVEANKLIHTAKKLAFVPDLIVSAGYTKRSNIDNRGDFVSASISFPLPFSSYKYASLKESLFEKNAMELTLKDYRIRKKINTKDLALQIAKITEELRILNKKSIAFASNARKVSSKSYSRGGASYIELLQSELGLQGLLLNRAKLKAMLLHKKIGLKNLLGEQLYE
jgi:cobalt-zinc-cadmium efflux system outer membrane protein